MTTENRDYLEMSFRSVRCFADDGVFSVEGFREIAAIVMRDGIIVDNEKRVLAKIIAKLTPAELKPEILKQVEQLKVKLGG